MHTADNHHCPCTGAQLAGGLGGRLDHTLSSLSTLHKWPHLHLVLWGEGNMAQLLTPGKHTIRPAKGVEGPTCGLVPLNGPAHLTSTGLKWNLGKPLSAPACNRGPFAWLIWLPVKT